MLTPHPTLRFGDLAPRSAPGTIREVLAGRALLHTYNGRAALYRYARALAPSAGKTVLVPAFHCTTVVDPFIQAGFEPRFYAVDERLRVDVDDVLAKLDHDTAAVVAVDFFGHPAGFEPLVAPCHAVGCEVLADCSHSFVQADTLQVAGTHADAAIFSFWKLVPSGVGGGLMVSDAGRLPRWKGVRATWRDSLVRTKALFEEAVQALGDHPINQAYGRLESLRTRGRAAPEVADELPMRAFLHPFDEAQADTRMPSLPRWVLSNASLRDIARRRRRNYEIVDEALSDIDGVERIFPALPASVCPWAYPVALRDRNDLDWRLRQVDVPVFTFGETLHPKLHETAHDPSPMLDRARRLSERLLCVPVHQGLTEDETKKMGMRMRELLLRHGGDG